MMPEAGKLTVTGAGPKVTASIPPPSRPVVRMLPDEVTATLERKVSGWGASDEFTTEIPKPYIPFVKMLPEEVTVTGPPLLVISIPDARGPKAVKVEILLEEVTAIGPPLKPIVRIPLADVSISPDEVTFIAPAPVLIAAIPYSGSGDWMIRKG